MDWINCNYCYIQPNPKLSFYLTSCGHLFCDKCINSSKGKEICFMCGARYNMTILNRNMSSDIAMFFTDLAKIQENNNKDITLFIRKKLEEIAGFIDQKNNSMKKIADFQRRHRTYFRDFFNKKLNNQDKTEKYERELIEQNKKIKKLEDECDYYKKMIENINKSNEFNQPRRSNNIDMESDYFKDPFQANPPTPNKLNNIFTSPNEKLNSTTHSNKLMFFPKNANHKSNNRSYSPNTSQTNRFNLQVNSKGSQRESMRFEEFEKALNQHSTPMSQSNNFKTPVNQMANQKHRAPDVQIRNSINAMAIRSNDITASPQSSEFSVKSTSTKVSKQIELQANETCLRDLIINYNIQKNHK